MPSAKDPIDLKNNLVDLATYRINNRTLGGKPDALVIHAAYAFDHLIYEDGRITKLAPPAYQEFERTHPNDTVSKFGQVYISGMPLLLQKKLADVLIDAAIDLRDTRGQFTVVMDGLRTFDSGTLMQNRRADLVELGMLARAGDSAHNRAFAVDSKLFEADGFTIAELPRSVPLSMLREADEHGHLDDMDMEKNHRFYMGAVSEAARENRLRRIQAWQRAAIKNHIAIANLLSEFWDDRVTGSPSDMWRVFACRALCINVDGNPKTNAGMQILRERLNALDAQYMKDALTRRDYIDLAYDLLTDTWETLFTQDDKQKLETILGAGGSAPPAKNDFIYHEWLADIYDRDLAQAAFPGQCLT